MTEHNNIKMVSLLIGSRPDDFWNMPLSVSHRGDAPTLIGEFTPAADRKAFPCNMNIDENISYEPVYTIQDISPEKYKEYITATQEIRFVHLPEWLKDDFDRDNHIGSLSVSGNMEVKMICQDTNRSGGDGIIIHNFYGKPRTKPELLSILERVKLLVLDKTLWVFEQMVAETPDWEPYTYITFESEELSQELTEEISQELGISVKIENPCYDNTGNLMNLTIILEKE